MFFHQKNLKVKMITDVLDHDLIFYCTYNQLCVFIVHGIYNFRLGIGISCTHETWSCSQQRFAGCFIYANSSFDVVCKKLIFLKGTFQISVLVLIPLRSKGFHMKPVFLFWENLRRILELEQPFFTSFEFWDFLGWKGGKMKNLNSQKR